MNQLSLDGRWKAAWFDGQRGCYQQQIDSPDADLSCYIDAQVPGEIHLDLIREGIIEDPSIAANAVAARWVEECIWTFRREVEVPAAALRGRSWLVFEELAYAADIRLNGIQLAHHANFFHPCRVETTGRLKKGKNLLTVHLDSGLFSVSDKPYEGYGVHLDGKLHKRQWIRMPQCEFSWDWAPRLMNVGIGKSVRLEWTDGRIRVERLVPLVTMAPDLAQATVVARVVVENLATDETECHLSVAMPALKAQTSKCLLLKPGENTCEIILEVSGFELWWPRGYGGQPLYDIDLDVRCGKRRETRRARLGFRKVEFAQPEHPEKGRYFRLEVNGIKIFVKGANFVPADFIFARIDKSRSEKLVALAAEANFNMLRIWGGGLYESDDFYALCDERGFLVWQEFCFSVCRYPGNDPEFMRSVEKEAVYQVRRLAFHPSLVAWCGSNEIEWHQTRPAGCRTGVVLPDYGLFHLVLPRIIADEDPGRYYQPSSPYSPDVSTHPNADECGDQHPWEIGFSNNDFRGYRKMACRFPCEGGILGPTSLPTLLACLPEGQRRHNSFAWMVHDNAIAPANWVNPPVDTITQLWLGKDMASLSLEEYAYWGGMLQGEGLKEYCENFRRRLFDSAAAVFWMYNDCWPTVRSWTIVDYALRRNPSFHFVRRAMSPIHVVLVEDAELGRCTVYGINDTGKSVSGRLRYGIFSLAGKYIKDVERETVLAANGSTPLASFASAEWTKRDQTMLFASLAGSNGVLIARNRLCDKLFKEMKWPLPKIEITVTKGRAVFKSSVFALDVCLDLDGETAYADNFFDLWPNVPYSLPWSHPAPPKIMGVGNLTRGRDSN